MISILIPIYNGIEYIEDSVSSVLKQTYEEWEILIAVNGHCENSEIYKIAKKYEEKSDKIKVFDFYQIKGKSNALNEVIKYCKFNYVAILDVDDIWEENKLEIQTKYIIENNYDVIGSMCVYFGDKIGIIPPIPLGDISNDDFSLVNPIINSSSIIKKELCHWNSYYDGVEDYDLWLKLRRDGKTFYNCKEALVKHRIHSDSAFNAQGNDNKVEDLLKSYGY